MGVPLAPGEPDPLGGADPDPDRSQAEPDPVVSAGDGSWSARVIDPLAASGLEPAATVEEQDVIAVAPDHLVAALDGLSDIGTSDVAAFTPGDDDHPGLLDPGGRDLLEGPIADHNLDGVDDTVHLHGHG